MYALGIGCSNGDYTSNDLCFTYEKASNFKTLPTNYLTMCHRIDLTQFPGLPAFNPMALVHGEESLTIHRQPQVDTEYTITETIVDCQDKKSGAMVVMQTEIKSKESGLIDATVQSGMFIRGLGGWTNQEAR